MVQTCVTLDRLRVRDKPICLQSQDDNVSTRNFADITDGLDSLHSQLTNLTPKQKDALDNALLEIAGFDKCKEMPDPGKLARSINELIRQVNVDKEIHLGVLAGEELRIKILHVHFLMTLKLSLKLIPLLIGLAPKPNNCFR